MATKFGVSKFKGLLFAGSFTVLASYVVRLTDSIVSGNLIGADALAGINLVSPILAAVSFLAGLISTGMATNYSLAMGRLEKDRSRQFFMQALWSVAIFGGTLALAILFGRNAFLSYLGADGAATAYAADYMKWVWPVAVIEGLQTLLISLGYADGDSKLCTTSYAVVFVLNLAVSVVSVKLGMGTSGCALASVVSETAGCLVMSVHFLKKTNTFRPVRHFAMMDSWRIATASFGDAAAFLCDALLFLFLNKFVIANFGSGVLPIVGVVTALWGFLEFFNGIGVAVQPIVTVYHGEGNAKSVRSVMNAAMWTAVIEGAAFMLFFGVFPELALKMVGVTEPELVREGCLAVRLMCAGFVALAFAGLFNSYYMFVERPLLAGVVTFSCYLFMPVACIAVGSIFGVSGIWAGIGVGPFAGCAFSSVFLIAVDGVAMFPLLLKRDREAKMHIFDIELTDFGIVEVSRQVAGMMTKAAIPESIIMRASLMVEEVLMVVKDRNKGRHVLGEVTLDLNDGITLTMRDDGEIFDITDSDQQISSLRSFLVASVMERQTGRINLVTTGFNRNVFRFEAPKDEKSQGRSGLPTASEGKEDHDLT